GKTHLSATAHPNDLMNTSIPGGVRALPSDLDVRLLADAFGYTVNLPSTRQTFLANFNSQNGVLTVNGDPQVVDDVITIDLSGGVRVNIDGVMATFAGTAVTAITVNARAGSDIINLEAALTPVTVNAGAGDDTINLAPVSGILNYLGSDLFI